MNTNTDPCANNADNNIGNHSGTHDKIELRSQKVRRLIGDVPGGLVRWGIALIALIFALLIIALVCLPYPYSDGESILSHLITPIKSSPDALNF